MSDGIEHNVDLSALNTFGIASTAEYFCRPESIDGVQACLGWANERSLAVHVLGGGSNVLLPDFLSGLVIQPALLGIEVQADGDEVRVTAGAGENWHQLVCYCSKNGFYGLENLALIPGSVGAAPIQNIGAYGVELKDVFFSLLALECQTGELHEFDSQACRFSYRESAFKTDLKHRFIIVSVTFLLSRTAHVNTSYGALSKAIVDMESTPQHLLETVVALRQSRLPDPALEPNVGSFFKNPLVPRKQYLELKARFPDLVAYNTDQSEVKLAAAWLMDYLGWKGKRCGKLAVHDRHALVLVNHSGAGLNDVIALAERIQQDVETHFNVALEREPQILGVGIAGHAGHSTAKLASRHK